MSSSFRFARVRLVLNIPPNLPATLAVVGITQWREVRGSEPFNHGDRRRGGCHGSRPGGKDAIPTVGIHPITVGMLRLHAAVHELPAAPPQPHQQPPVPALVLPFNAKPTRILPIVIPPVEPDAVGPQGGGSELVGRVERLFNCNRFKEGGHVFWRSSPGRCSGCRIRHRTPASS